MLKITRQQMARFATSSVRNFEDRMVRHLGERFPLLSAAKGPEGLLHMVQREIGRAALHGITVEKDVRRFIELSSALDGDLDDALDPPQDTEGPAKTAPRTPAETLERIAELAPQKLFEAPAAANDALRREAASAVADTSPGATDDPSGGKTPVGQPVMPCPGKSLRKRLCAFST